MKNMHCLRTYDAVCYSWKAFLLTEKDFMWLCACYYHFAPVIWTLHCGENDWNTFLVNNTKFYLRRKRKRKCKMTAYFSLTYFFSPLKSQILIFLFTQPLCQAAIAPALHAPELLISPSKSPKKLKQDVVKASFEQSARFLLPVRRLFNSGSDDTSVSYRLMTVVW